MGRRRFKPYELTLDIIDAATDGRAVAKEDEKVIFVEDAVPGDKALVKVFRKQKGIFIGKVTEVIEPSPDRVDPACQHFDVCGGCKWQNMSYEAQAAAKQKQVVEAIQRIGKVPIAEIMPILANETAYGYRNKLEFSFSDKAWLSKEDMHREDIDQRSLGYHVPRIFDKVIQIEECLLQKPIINDIRNELVRYAREHDYPFYNMKSHEGFLRNLAFRTTEANNELMLILIVADDRLDLIDPLFSHLVERFPQVTNWVWIVNQKKNNSYTDLAYRLWRGEPFITEKLGQYSFRISPVSFFQTNPRQAERLYGVVKEFFEETLPEGQSQQPVLYDLYSGTGSIGIFVSKLAKKVVGIEYVEDAIRDARVNVELNELLNFSFYAGDMKKILTDELVSREGSPNVIIADPPRAGMDPKVVQQIIKVAPEYLIYVSCKPATQARDIQLMAAHYDLLKIRPVDMFPQTAHVENVALLKRKA
ncbi:MAG: 23S rRNA (uracil(1939)-C(5))-methyltransferase RlmD [Bacteroidota bacterium]